MEEYHLDHQFLFLNLLNNFLIQKLKKIFRYFFDYLIKKLTLKNFLLLYFHILSNQIISHQMFYYNSFV